MPKVLVITANSKNDLQLAAELREIRESLGEQSNFTVIHEGEVRAKDLIRRLLSEPPEILHFAGHGLGGSEQAITLVGDNGREVILTKRHLGNIFKQLPVKPRVVVLNACFSGELGEELKKSVEVVIGAEGRIGDETARRFAANLYAALGHSCSVRKAFELAQTELSISGFDPAQVVIDHLPTHDPDKIVFYARPQLMAQFALTRSGKPDKYKGHYGIHLWLRGVDQHVECVSFEIHHDSFRPKDRYWEITRSESTSFLTDDLRTKGDVMLRATVWSRDRGIGIQEMLSSALERQYGDNPDLLIAEAIKTLKES